MGHENIAKTIDGDLDRFILHADHSAFLVHQRTIGDLNPLIGTQVECSYFHVLIFIQKSLDRIDLAFTDQGRLSIPIYKVDHPWSHPDRRPVFIVYLDKNVRFEEGFLHELHAVAPFPANFVERAIAFESLLQQELVHFLFPPGSAVYSQPLPAQ